MVFERTTTVSARAAAATPSIPPGRLPTTRASPPPAGRSHSAAGASSLGSAAPAGRAPGAARPAPARRQEPQCGRRVVLGLGLVRVGAGLDEQDVAGGREHGPALALRAAREPPGGPLTGRVDLPQRRHGL